MPIKSMEQAMHEFKEGNMHSGTGVPGERLKEPVTSRKQAIAIGLSETGQSNNKRMKALKKLGG
jgi:hypothetical protein